MRTPRFLCAALVVATAAAALVALPGPSAGAVQGTVSASAASSWQTNGTVRAIVVANGVVYLGGDFTSVRPPGSALGTGEVARSYLAAFNASTGALITTINPTLNGAVHSLAKSPDGTVVYVGGDFTTVAGSTRNRLAALTASSGALRPFNANVNGRVRALATTSSTVYLGGAYSTVGGASRKFLAAVDATSGALRTGFVANTDNVVYAVALSKQNDKLYAGGAFTSVNGTATAETNAAASVNPASGAILPFPAASVIPVPNPGCISQMKSIDVDQNSVYFGAEGTGGGCFDGTFAANVADGSLKWQSKCLGATQGVAVLNGLLYTGSHSHDCTGDMGFDPDAFPEVGWSKGFSRHLLARDLQTGKVSSFYADTNGGASGGLGPRVLATDGSQIFVGGEFTTVNGVAQQGFTRFSSTGASAVPARPASPVAVPRPGGKVSVAVQAPIDLDDTDLVVRLYRDGAPTPIATAPVHSLFWRKPVVTFEDNALALGSAHTYRADAIEANGTQASPLSSTSNTVTVATSAGTYADAVSADGPTQYWRLGEAAAPAVADSSAWLSSGSSQGTPTLGVAGAINGDANKAMGFNGSSQFLSSGQKVSSPGSFSVEAWVNTTSTSGGKIIGFGDRQAGLDFGGNPAMSSSYDKHLYMANDGTIVFGVYTGGTVTLSSSPGMNNGQWHHVVGTQGPAGMQLFVDGNRVAKNAQAANQPYDGWWRVGGDNLNGWPNQPSSNLFAGSVDEVAVYPAALSTAQVRAHFSASGRVAPVDPAPVVPADAYGATVYADSPASYWRLDEATPPVAADASNNGVTGTWFGAPALGQAGALPTGTAATLNGAGDQVASADPVPSPSVYSTELWFNTTTTQGGKLIGFGDQQNGDSGQYDKHVYMTNDGTLTFGVWNGQPDTITSPLAYNDGAWHHMVATQGPAGMSLYVDDKLVGTNPVTTNQGYGGFWRVGGDNLNSWPNQPASSYFAGSVDDVAVYNTVLSAAQVDAHFVASGRTP